MSLRTLPLHPSHRALCVAGMLQINNMMKPQDSTGLTVARVDEVLAQFFSLVKLDPSHLPDVPPPLPPCPVPPTRSRPAPRHISSSVHCAKSLSG